MNIGFVVNPVAGIGGAVALKGSDGGARQTQALARGATLESGNRAASFVAALGAHPSEPLRRLSWLTWAGNMGSQILSDHGIDHEVVGFPPPLTSADDTQQACRALHAGGIDLLVFVGGDGTARDVLAAVGESIPVLGVPAGVKMHSGVFAVTPKAAAGVIERLIVGDLVAPITREVRDFDESSNSTQGIAVKTFGTLRVPEPGGYLQQTKVGGKESEPITIEEICAYVQEILDLGRPIVLGPGSTCERIKQELGIEATLRGCDVRNADGSTMTDATAGQLETLAAPQLVVSFTRGQGFLFGRGNQQISARFLANLGWPKDVFIVGSRTKLTSCEGRPLLVDTSDDALDEALTGLVEIIAGYDDRLLYRVSGFVS